MGESQLLLSLIVPLLSLSLSSTLLVYAKELPRILFTHALYSFVVGKVELLCHDDEKIHYRDIIRLAALRHGTLPLFSSAP